MPGVKEKFLHFLAGKMSLCWMGNSASLSNNLCLQAECLPAMNRPLVSVPLPDRIRGGEISSHAAQEADVKAAERKELETNYLADQLGRLVQGENPHAPVWVAILAVGALIWLAYWAVPRQARERITLAWGEFWRVESGSPLPRDESDWPRATAENMKEMAARQRGTPTQSSARFVLAQAEQALALEYINDAERSEVHLQRAEELYRQMLVESGLSKEMRVRSQIGLAQVAETRFWVQKAQLQPEERERRWSRVLELYQEALRVARREFPDSGPEAHPLVRETEAHLRRLNDPQTAELVFLHGSPSSTSPTNPITVPGHPPADKSFEPQ